MPSQVLGFAFLVKDPPDVFPKTVDEIRRPMERRNGRNPHPSHLAPPIRVWVWRARHPRRYGRCPPVDDAVSSRDEIAVDGVGRVAA